MGGSRGHASEYVLRCNSTEQNFEIYEKINCLMLVENRQTTPGVKHHKRNKYDVEEITAPAIART